MRTKNQSTRSILFSAIRGLDGCIEVILVSSVSTLIDLKHTSALKSIPRMALNIRRSYNQSQTSVSS